MPDITITGVQFTTNLKAQTIRFGETVADFDIVYLNADKTYWKADATDVLKAKAVFFVMMGGIATGYGLAIPISGSVTLVGATLTQGIQYVVSVNPGKIAPKSDLTTGQFITELFTAASAAIADQALEVTGITIP